MSRRSRSAGGPAARAGLQMMELAMAVPQVVAHRVTRMALAGPTPSARDRREFHQMGAEKLAAFQESWLAMFMQAALMQQRLLMNWWRPWWLGSPSQMQVLNKGLGPVHRRAVANAKRLGRTPLR